MFYLHHHSFTFDEIKKNSNHSSVHHPAWQLAHDWLNGKKEFVFKTSGSTGIPKELRFKREQITASVNRTIEAFGFNNKDHFLCCLSMQSVAGAMMLFRALELNASITIMDTNSHPLSKISEVHPFTSTSFVPLQLHDLADHTEWMKKLDRFKTILIGGSVLNPKTEKLLQSCKAQVFQTYGMTETLSHVALHNLRKQEAFHALKNVEIKTDKHGCLCIKADVTNHEWITTNDLVEILPDHSFRLLGRADQVINTGGVKVFPARVEAIIGKYLHGRKYFIHGMPHAKWGEQVTLFIEGEDEDTSMDKWWDKIAGELHDYELPKQIFYISEFTKTESGKVDRINTCKELQQLSS